ncbi:unnamed protein product [Cuscuta epithymum]|uniref:feruloyl-CoA 6-hydroxylase n=1 Tax=Cuscuta epithymum TaxID=186058 RepID=A0AAV0C0Y0_9ASTE|nr:unnamed protein product [Cuscuta epithymum]
MADYEAATAAHQTLIHREAEVLQALSTVIQLHFEKTLEKKRAVDLQKKELWKMFQLFFIFLALVVLGQAQSSRLQCRHCWVPIGLLSMGHLIFYVSVAQTLRCINGFKYQRRCHKLTLGEATERLRQLKMRISGGGGAAAEECEIHYQQPPESYFDKLKRNWALHFGFLILIYAFMAIGHGMCTSFLDKVLQVSRGFFEQPMEEKMKYAKGLNDFEGYGADPPPQEGQPLDWSDRLYLNVHPQDMKNYNFWPKNPDSFRQVVEEYTDKIKMVIEMTSKAMARSLNLEESCFHRQFGERSQLSVRFNYYSPCQRPDLVLGLKPHSDGSGYTVIIQDEAGLQVLKNDKWFTVPKNPHAILVIMGDQMEIMSNGIFKSPVHRVLSSSERDRISVAVFYTPEIGTKIGPEKGLFFNDEERRVYKRVKDYADLHWENFQSGKGMRALLHIAHV